MPFSFKTHYEDVRGIIEDPKNREWILHTNLGSLSFRRIVWHEAGGYVGFHCYDEGGHYRYIMFTEDQLSLFPLEVKAELPKHKGREADIGFALAGRGEDVSGAD
jgi:hypothetical protein